MKKRYSIHNKSIPANHIAYNAYGRIFIVGDSLALLNSEEYQQLKGSICLIITSPPFPLNHKKKYGNKIGNDYLEWFASMAPILSGLLTDDGSIVIELGNAWEPERPVQSLLPLKASIAFTENENVGLRLI